MTVYGRATGESTVGRLLTARWSLPGPGPLCSRNGARTWAGRQSEPQLGGGKTSGDEAAIAIQLFPVTNPPKPHPPDNFIVIGPWLHVRTVYGEQSWRAGRAGTLVCIHILCILGTLIRYRNTYEHVRDGDKSIVREMDPQEDHLTKFIHNDDTTLSNH